VLLHHGRVGVIPTDTIYGLAARAIDRQAVARLYALKSREHKPGTIIAASVDQLIGMGVEAGDLHKMEHLWPNPISVVIKALPGLEYLHQDVGSLAVRIPDDEELRALLEQTGPLLTSSANLPDRPPANNITEARHYFADNVDFYVDGDDLSGSPASTVLRVNGDEVETLRAGAITVNERGEIV
jgi:tRNA threonylcarbamoyl adenosine modification protein (Sua5/YciO/YrdC/YwlC family)